MFEMLEYLNLGTKKKKIFLEPNFICRIYVEKKLFDADLNIGLESLEHAKKQLIVDLPRSEFRFNGKKFTSIPENIPDSIIPYCTQCVMGLPVTILFETLGIVAEGRHPMIVLADENCNVCIYKKLRILKEEGDLLHKVGVFVHADKDDIVEINYVFEQ